MGAAESAACRPLCSATSLLQLSSFSEIRDAPGEERRWARQNLAKAAARSSAAGRPAGRERWRPALPGTEPGMAARLFLRRGSHGGGGLGCILVGFCSRVPRLIGLLLFGLRGESEPIWLLALKMRFFLLSTDAWERTRQLLFLSVFLFLKNGSHQSRGTSFRAPGRRIIRSFGLGPFGP